jgi:excisionase family DNA binding protein
MSSRVAVVITPTTRLEDLPQFLSIQQAALLTQQSEYTIRAAVREGRIPSTRRFGRKRVFIPRSHFLAEPQQ